MYGRLSSLGKFCGLQNGHFSDLKFNLFSREPVLNYSDIRNSVSKRIFPLHFNLNIYPS